MRQPLIGAPLDRVEGGEKVTGRTVFTADVVLPGMVHGVVVTSSVANGRIRSIDAKDALALPGMLGVMTHENAPRVNAGGSPPMPSLLFLLQNDAVQFDRQPVAVVVAETFEDATRGAELVRVAYDAIAPEMDLETAPAYVPEQIFGEPADRHRGDPRAAFSAAHVRLEQTYRTPTEHHNPLETHGTIAAWAGDRLTLYDSTQWAFGVRARMATVFGIEPELIHVIAPFVGGAFGSKGQPWSHVALAAMAAKMMDRPVKVLATRPQMFAWVGHRPQTEQKLSIGCSRDGRLQSVIHETTSETSAADDYVEPCGVFSRGLYAVPNYAMSHELRRLNISKPTYMRAPGEATGSFALESAMDELAYELGMDPLELRLRNYAQTDPDSGKPYTSKALRECYRLAAERFDWKRRNPEPRSTRDGRLLTGLGMATASGGSFRSHADVRIRMHADGTVVVSTGTIEQGTGSPTAYAQIAAEILGVPYERVRFEFGDTSLPYAPLAAGSQTSSSVGSAVTVAAQRLRERLADSGGRVPPDGIEINVEEKPRPEEDDYAQASFGAHFVEVAVDPDLGSVRVMRFVAAFGAGRIINAKLAESQFLGGIVWGISMALFEETRFDLRTGRIMNANLADYLVPTNGDIPPVEIIMAEEDDQHVNPAHVKGIGEVAMTGSAAAVANAVYHATGVRVRDLPITAEKLLGGARR